MAAPVTKDANYPMFDPAADTGNYVLPLFEAGSKANGVHLHAGELVDHSVAFPFSQAQMEGSCSDF